MSVAAPEAAARPRTVLINRNFALLWGGQIISNVGDFMFSTTIVLWIATSLAVGQSWAPLAVSGEFLALTAPIVLIGPLAGVFVDRWDKRRTLLLMDALRAAVIAITAPLATPIGDWLPLGWRLAALYGAIAAISTCSQFFSPARLALIGDIVPQAQQARASSLLFMTLSFGVVIGPVLAAPLYFTFSPALAFTVDALSFLLSFAAIRAIRAPRSARSVIDGAPGAVFSELLAGLRFFFGARILRVVLLVTALTLTGSSAINALGVFFLTANLHSPPDLYGVISGATGVGVLIGSVVAAWVVPRLGAARSFWLSTLIVGMLLVLYARQTEFIWAAAMLVILGLPSAGLNVAIGPLILATTPREMIGRVAATLTPATSLAATLSAAGAGYLASTLLRGYHASVLGVEFGPYDTIYLGGGLLIVLGGLYAMTMLRAAPAQDPVKENNGEGPRW